MRTNVYLLADEVYEHIVFDGVSHQSFLRHDELWERSFIVSSFGKTYHATGWKVGYCVAPAALTTEFRKIHQWVCYAVVSPIQYALADYMRGNAGTLSGVTNVLCGETRPLLRAPEKFTIQIQASPGNLFPDSGLCRDNANR